MIIPANSSLNRRIQRQLPASYMEPLNFSFDLEMAGIGNDVSFGLSRANNATIINYDLKDGKVFDYSGRFVGTYQDGNNKFSYRFNSGSWQKINGRLVSTQDPLPGYSSTPFEKFYVNNYSDTDIELNLSINGFIPPTVYQGFATNDMLGLQGSFVQSGLSAHPGEEIIYGVFNISVPPEYGYVDSFESAGTGKINYTITGGSYATDDVIPVTFDTYYGLYTVGVPITGVFGGGGGTEPAAAGQSGTYISLYGIDNLMGFKQGLDFGLDYYSNTNNIVSIELDVMDSNTETLLSGTGAGFVTYEGYIIKSGLLNSNGLATGIADLWSAPNSIYNTQYDLRDRYLNISKKRSGFDQLPTPYIGVNTFLFTGIVLTGVYDGPRPELIGQSWKATGDVSIDYEFTTSDGGVAIIDNNYLGYANPAYNPFGIFVGTSLLPYPTDPSVFPTGPGYGGISAVRTGQGYMTVKSPVTFFGSGTGRIFPGSTLVSTLSTGTNYYKGDIKEWYGLFDYPGPDYPGPDYPPVDDERFGAVSICYGDYSIGQATVNGETVLSQAPLDPGQTTWGYGQGPTDIVFLGGGLTIRRYLSIPTITATSPTGDPILTGYTGWATGFIKTPGFTVAGPTFLPPKNTTLSPYIGQGPITANSGAEYGRSCIFSGVNFTYNSINLNTKLVPVAPQVTFNLKYVASSVQSVYNSTYTNFAEPIYTKTIYPYKEGSDSEFNYYLKFKNEDVTPSTPGSVFVGQAKVAVSGAGVFNLIESNDETTMKYDYTALNWISGDTLVRPVPETYPKGSATRILHVDYVPLDSTSVGVAVLRVSTSNATGVVQITGNSNGIRN